MLAFIVFGLLALGTLGVLVYLTRQALFPHKVYVADVGDLETLAYGTIPQFYANDGSRSNTKLLDCQEAPIGTDMSVFYRYAETLSGRSTLRLYGKTFRVQAEYSLRRDVEQTQKGETAVAYFDAVCFTREKDGLLMDAGMLLINETLPSRFQQQRVVVSYSTNTAITWMFMGVCAFLLVVWGIVCGILFKRMRM